LNTIFGSSSLNKKGDFKMNNCLKEFKFYDGEEYITFNLVWLDTSKKEVQVAVTNRGKISVITYDLYEDWFGLYFEFGCEFKKIRIKDFI
jgi:hypothetical protein